MDEKVRPIIEKALLERKKAQFPKALKRLEQAIEKFPDAVDLYVEAADVAIDAAESRRATRFIKQAFDRFPNERGRLQLFLHERIHATNDPVIARFALDAAVKLRALDEGRRCLDELNDHGARDLQQRVRTKKQTLHSAEKGGYQFRGSLLGLGICEVMVSLRLGRFKEAVTLVCAVLGEKPMEHEAFTPFFKALSDEHPRSGRLRLAYARSLMAAGQSLQALDQLLEAARIENAVTAPCIDFAREIECTAPEYPARLQRALGEMLLLRGEVSEALVCFDDALENSPENAAAIVALLQPHVNELECDIEVRMTHCKAALLSEQTPAAIASLERLNTDPDGQKRVFEFLEAANPTALAKFHGELALTLGEFERAANVLEQLCQSSPEEVAAVLKLVEPHHDAHPDLAGLIATHTTLSTTPATAGRSESSFEHFENKEFTITGNAVAAGFERKDGPTEKPKSTSRPRFTQPIGGHEIDWGDTAEMLATDPAPADSGQTHTIATVAEEAVEITELHVANVAQALRNSGAATFFHIEREDSDAVATAPVAPVPDAPIPEPVVAGPGDTFDDRYTRFQRGQLPNTETIALFDEAIGRGRFDAARELLYFEPDTDGEAFARRFNQAEYHMLTDHPHDAMKLLRLLESADAPVDKQYEVGVKTAVCQRMMSDYAGAHETLDRLRARFPESQEVETLARKNYEQYLEVQCTDAPVLEKTTSLHVDA